MKRFMARAGLLALIILFTGCSTFFSRVPADRQAKLFPATKFAMDAAGDGWCWMFLACPALMVSLPVDAALDTLLLPVDAVRVHSRQQSKKAESSRSPKVTEPS
ncbi:YceK/YidQ family lipoprotein [Pseudomonas sp. 8Z]|uniref:YceK/YidQ family lipoprotein n=1 Tax=Pseudomonas sp. 8Z TaxID=2653166 RepID=UPI0012F17AB8|nr:YceK/YidQ family lipoprotein [Pseudomonas sp. 8Z]VXC87377.1 YceK/YidQ family lipoprotein [Pseudomonas sp. 8Z]